MTAAARSLALLPPPASDWITADDACLRLGWSRTTFFRRRAEFPSKTLESTAANGRAITVYFCPSTIVPAAPDPAELLGELFRQPQRQAASRAALPDAALDEEAEKKYAAIKPVILFEADPSKFRRLQLADGSYITSKERLYHYIAACSGHSVRTLKAWASDFKRHGKAGLAVKPRSDRGVARWALGSPEMAKLANVAAYAYVRENLNMRMTWRILEARARQLAIEPPSYRSVVRMLENLPDAPVTLSREDRESYDRVFAPYIQRAYEMGAGEILCSDHALHDVLVADDLWEKDRKLIRVRFTGLIDMRSRRFVGYAWSQEGSSRSFTAALRMVLSRFGRPRAFYFDNGKDFQKCARGARGGPVHAEDIGPEAMGVIARLGCEIKFCKKFHPQSKLIERANLTIHTGFDVRWSTYCGSAPHQRPERCDKLAARHEFLLKQGRVEESEVPLASEFIRAARLWIEAEFNLLDKNVQGMDNESPVEAWERYKWDGLEQVDMDAIAPLLMSRARRVITRGRIQLGDTEYVAADPESSIALHDRSGEDRRDVLVLYDESDPAYIAAADLDGYVFAYLKPETLLRQSDDPETRAAIAASMQERGAHHKRTRGLLADLDRRALSTGYVPQKSQMLQIGNLPIAIDDVVVHRPVKPRLRPNKSAIAPASASDIAANFWED